MKSKNIKVIIVDDSATIRKMLKKGLSKHPHLEVIATARDPYEARDLIVELHPDVITLDLEMPRMGGLEFISVLMEHWPLPIIVVSSLIKANCETSLKALELGAIDVFTKPQINQSHSLPHLMSELAEMVFHAAQAKVQPLTIIPSFSQNQSRPLSKETTTDKVVAIGASTGGTEAIRHVLQPLPASTPGILVVQHMPPLFTKTFADRLNTLCPSLEVREAVNGETLHPGLVLIAPGDQHLLLKRSHTQYYVEVKTGPRVCRHRPSVDVLFQSVAEVAGKNAVGVILTGMGNDGARGLFTMKQAGAKTLAQDESSCVVYGMPKAAVTNGAVEKTVPLLNIAETIYDYC